MKIFRRIVLTYLIVSALFILWVIYALGYSVAIGDKSLVWFNSILLLGNIILFCVNAVKYREILSDKGETEDENW